MVSHLVRQRFGGRTVKGDYTETSSFLFRDNVLRIRIPQPPTTASAGVTNSVMRNQDPETKPRVNRFRSMIDRTADFWMEPLHPPDDLHEPPIRVHSRAILSRFKLRKIREFSPRDRLRTLVYRRWFGGRRHHRNTSTRRVSSRRRSAWPHAEAADVFPDSGNLNKLSAITTWDPSGIHARNVGDDRSGSEDTSARTRTTTTNSSFTPSDNDKPQPNKKSPHRKRANATKQEETKGGSVSSRLGRVILCRIRSSRSSPLPPRCLLLLLPPPMMLTRVHPRSDHHFSSGGRVFVSRCGLGRRWVATFNHASSEPKGTSHVRSVSAENSH